MSDRKLQDRPQKVIIAGGGLAGLSCAKRLVETGHDVFIYEGAPFLGGRASTYRDADGDWIEQGLHLFLGAYSQFRKLLEDIGRPPDETLAWMKEVRFHDPIGPVKATYAIDPLRAPLETLRAILGNNDYLGALDKLSMLPLLGPGLATLEQLKKLDGETTAAWWAKTNGHDNVMTRFIRPFCRAIQFTEPEQLSAYNFLSWVHHVSRDPAHVMLGGYCGARDETIFSPLGRYLTDRGAKIRVNAKLRGIDLESPRSVGAFLLERGERLEGDIFVAAIPQWDLLPLVPSGARDLPYFMSIASLPVCPAISVQIWFDRPVVGTSDFTLVANSPAAVYQEQSTTAYPTKDGGGRISVIVSPADELMRRPDEALVEMVIASIGRAQPDIAAARVTKSVVLKHPRHLVRPLPGAMMSRPTQATPLFNFFLAGDWTQQPFFGSQEGAVRSGQACAQAILDAISGAVR